MSAMFLNKYETVIVTRHDAGYEAQKRFIQRVEELMEKEGAKAVRFEYWGKKKLAYPIRKVTKGIYLYHVYYAPPDFIKKLNRFLQVSNVVLRHLTVNLQTHVDIEKTDIEAERHFDTVPTEEEKEYTPVTGWELEYGQATSSQGYDEEEKEEEEEEEAEEEEGEKEE
jgi:small subunit ribosomal protein S6